MSLISLLITLFVLAVICYIVYLFLKAFVIPNIPPPGGQIVLLVFALFVLLALLSIFGFLPDLNVIRIGRP